MSPAGAFSSSQIFPSNGTAEFRQAIRARFTRPIIVAGNYDKARAEWVLSKGYADLVAFGRPFVANPDLPRRLAKTLPLATLDSSALFGGGEGGYTDYPRWSAARQTNTRYTAETV
jgi:N-ethylmaleimide reductase